MTYEYYKMMRWVLLGFFATVAICVGFAAMTNGPMAALIACFPYVQTCTTSQSSYSQGNVTCRCEAVPK